MSSAQKINSQLVLNLTLDSETSGTSTALSGTTLAVNENSTNTVLAKVSTNSYTVTYTVTQGDVDRAASAAIPISLTLTDAAGNSSIYAPSTGPSISYAIDAHAPLAITLTSGYPATASLGGKVALDWTNPSSDFDHTIVSWTDASGYSDSYTASGAAGAEVAYTTPVLKSGNAYTISITTYDAAGNSTKTDTSATPVASTLLVDSIAVSTASTPVLTVTLGSGSGAPTYVYYWSGTAFPPSSPSSVAWDAGGVTLTGITKGNDFSFYLYNSSATSTTYTVTYGATAYSTTLYARSLGGSNSVANVSSRSKSTTSRSSSNLLSDPDFDIKFNDGNFSSSAEAQRADTVRSAIVMQPISMRYAPTVASRVGAAGIDSSSFSLLNRAARSKTQTAVRYTETQGASRSSSSAQGSAPAETQASRSSSVAQSQASSATAGARAASEGSSTSSATELRPLPKSSAPAGKKLPSPQRESAPGTELYVKQEEKRREDCEESEENVE